jgi:hypothetical protein
MELIKKDLLFNDSESQELFEHIEEITKQKIIKKQIYFNQETQKTIVVFNDFKIKFGFRRLRLYCYYIGYDIKDITIYEFYNLIIHCVENNKTNYQLK